MGDIFVLPEELADPVRRYRARTFRILPVLRINNIDEALSFVNERGFIFFWPIKKTIFPSLWAAVAGDRLVPDDHDDPGHVTWGWKDQMLGKKQWYYGRFLCRKNSIISLKMLPYFYALSPNYGDFEHDYLDQYHLGQMTAESKNIYEALLYEGALDTISLRRAAHLTSEASSSRFQRALDQLQLELKIMPVGISEAGAWKYAFIYEILPRHLSDIQQRAQLISENAARSEIVAQYLRAVGAANLTAISRFFRWNEKDCLKAVMSQASQTGLEIFELMLQNEKWFFIQDIKKSSPSN